jgi:hypothetical protein
MINHYVDNKQLYDCIVQYKSQCIEAKQNKKDKPRIPNYAGKCILMIAERLSLKPNFINYSFRDEMISDGVENCISYFDNYDPAKSTNAFAYFTQIIYYAFLRRILKEKKQQYVKYKSLENIALFDDIIAQDEESFNINSLLEIDSHHVDIIKAFEDNILSNKNKKKTKKGIEKFLEE